MLPRSLRPGRRPTFIYYSLFLPLDANAEPCACFGSPVFGFKINNLQVFHDLQRLFMGRLSGLAGKLTAGARTLQAPAEPARQLRPRPGPEPDAPRNPTSERENRSPSTTEAPAIDSRRSLRLIDDNTTKSHSEVKLTHHNSSPARLPAMVALRRP